MTNEIIKIKDAVELQLRKTDGVIASNEAVTSMISKVNSAISDIPDAISKVNDTLSSNFDVLDEGLQEINYTLVSGFGLLAEGLQELCFITKTGFLEIIDRLELQNETLKAIKEILEKPLDIQAKELRKRAEFAYLNNWIDEAETDLLEAEKKNYQDFIVLQILGNIYYHHKKNYPKAIEYYQKAAKYAAPVLVKHASNALICVSTIYYQLNQIPNAYKATEKALELSPNDPHVLYHHARYSAKMGYEFTNFLKKSVYKDPHYLVATDADEIFSKVKRPIQKLVEELRDEKKKEVDNLLQKINLVKKEAETTKIGDSSFLNEQLAEIEKLYSFNRHLDFQKDFLQPKKTAQDFYEKRMSEFTSSLDKQLMELKRVYSRNSYFDFLEAKKIGQNIYLDFQKIFLRVKEIAQEIYPKNIPAESLSALMTIKRAHLSKLEEKKRRIEDKSYVGWGWFSFFFVMFVFGLLLDFMEEKLSSDVIMFLLVITIIVMVSIPRVIRPIRLYKIKSDIKKEDKVFARLLNIKELLGKLQT